LNYHILQILDADELHEIVSDLAQQTFVDGTRTATGIAKAVKNNLQVGPSGPDAEAPNTEVIDGIVIDAIWRNDTFQALALPRRILAPLFARYEVGMSYGSHVDAAIMGPGDEPLRCDLAMTIFLSDPDTYEGGGLVLETPFGEQQIKLAAGEAVVYPATTLHRVDPVTRGTRFVAVTWIQSLVRDERLRTILFDLSMAAEKTEALREAELTAALNKSCHNLLRYAADV